LHLYLTASDFLTWGDVDDCCMWPGCFFNNDWIACMCSSIAGSIGLLSVSWDCYLKNKY